MDSRFDAGLDCARVLHGDIEVHKSSTRLDPIIYRDGSSRPLTPEIFVSAQLLRA
jgi:hypothetical protein